MKRQQIKDNKALSIVLLWFHLTFGHGLNLTIITVLIGQNPSYGYQAMAPVFDIVLEDMKVAFPQLFSNVSHHVVYYPGSYSCSDGGDFVGLVAQTKVWDLVNHYSYRNSFVALFCPACSRDVIPLGDFAREWNVPLFASVASSPLLGNKSRFPTVITFPASDDTSLPAAVKSFLDLHNWRMVTIVCDFSIRYQNLYTAYTLTFENVRKKLSEIKGLYDIRSHKFDSSESQDYTLVLHNLSSFSHVIILLASPRILRNVMIAAHWLNMTNGDYVFVSVQTNRIPYFGNLTWQYNDENDKFAFEAFQTLITIANPDPAWEKYEDFVDKYATVSQKSYNFTLTEDTKLNDRAISTYECVQAFAMVLNEMQQNTSNEAVDRFVKRFWNRNYTFTFRRFYINSDGIRINNVQFLRLNVASGKMEVNNFFRHLIKVPINQQELARKRAWYFNVLTSELLAVSNLSMFWKGRNRPPDDHFMCGYCNKLCTYISWSETITGVLCSAGCILIGIIAGLFYIRSAGAKETKSLWWSLDPAIMSMKRLPRKTSAVYNDVLCQCTFTYDGVPVWISAFSPGNPVTQLQSISAIKNILASIRALRNDNVSQFLGILTTSKETLLLFGQGERGSLRQLLDSAQLTFDGQLQSSAVWDVLSGLDYIQSSSLQTHGSVSSLAATVDRRFCIRLCDYATTKILLTLTKHNIATCFDIKLLWKAPEILADDTLAPTQKADVYSVGVVLAEIFTRNYPMRLSSFCNESDVQESLQKLKTESEPRISFDTLFPPEVELSTKNCLKLFPDQRPTLKQLISQMSEDVQKENIVDSVMSRLLHYANDLETSVQRRTAALLEEGEKVDALLAEIIPRRFVQRLRNKELVEAEQFDSVTIMFCKFSQSTESCLGMSQLDMVAVLGHIYSVFDEVLSRFDVYKVEAINDSYLIASGLPTRSETCHAEQIGRTALALQKANNDLVYSTSAYNKTSLDVRVGFHSGPCAAGIVGHRMPRYCIFGDTVNTASRMESHGEVSRIHLSLASNTMLAQDGKFLVELRGNVFIKGKGIMETYWLVGLRE